jgi:hypothetical protein
VDHLGVTVVGQLVPQVLVARDFVGLPGFVIDLLGIDDDMSGIDLSGVSRLWACT